MWSSGSRTSGKQVTALRMNARRHGRVSLFSRKNLVSLSLFPLVEGTRAIALGHAAGKSQRILENSTNFNIVVSLQGK